MKILAALTLASVIASAAAYDGHTCKLVSLDYTTESGKIENRTKAQIKKWNAQHKSTLVYGNSNYFMIDKADKIIFDVPLDKAFIHNGMEFITFENPINHRNTGVTIKPIYKDGYTYSVTVLVKEPFVITKFECKAEQ